MRVIKGSSIAQYVIIIALISVALVSAFFIMGQNIFNQFSNQGNYFSEMSEVSKDNLAQLQSNTNSDSSSNDNDVASPDNPQMKCSNGKCDIDFGSYVLNGVPADFSDIEQSTGTPGATEELASLLDQLIKIAENSDPPMDEELFKNLANEGHNMAFSESLSVSEALKIIKMSADSQSRESDLNSLFVSFQNDAHASNFQNILTDINDKYKGALDPQTVSLLNLTNLLSDEIISLSESHNQDLEALSLDPTLKPVVFKRAEVTDIDSAIICSSAGHKDNDKNCK